MTMEMHRAMMAPPMAPACPPVIAPMSDPTKTLTATMAIETKVVSMRFKVIPRGPGNEALHGREAVSQAMVANWLTDDPAPAAMCASMCA